MKRFFPLLLLLAFFLAGCAASPILPSAPELIDPAQVQPKTAVVTRDTLTDVTTLAGNIAMEVQGVSFLTDGTVEAVKVIPGQAVSQGDILAVLDTEALQQQLEALTRQQAETAYSNALTNQNLQIDADICKLQLEDLISRQAAALQAKEEALAAMTASGTEAELQALKAQIEDLKARQALEKQLCQLELADAELALKHAKQTQAHAAKQTSAAIALLESKLENTTITAPMDGIVTWISSAKTVSSDKPYLYISDPTRRYIRTVEYNSLTLQAAESIYALVDDIRYDLTYRPLDLETEYYQTLNSIPLHSFFDFREDAAIPESANALVFCVHGFRENVLTVPTGALNRNENGYFVYRQTDGQREQIYIQTGLITPLQAEVISGLEEGDVVYAAD